MIRGYKPNGYVQAADRDGFRHEYETRQCIHCQFTWSYGEPHPPEELGALLGHPTRRGWCVRCNGWLCGRRVCMEQQLKLTEGTPFSCMPVEEWNNRLLDKVGKRFPLDPELTITAEGLIVPRTALAESVGPVNSDLL